MTRKAKKKQEKASSLQCWLRKIDWKRRVKAVCKPCWEIKYCPYGALVESFPAKEAWDDGTCRIFGHDCPVFSVAEPFTETKELRNISRSIPRAVQFRVLKRENQICSNCGQAVKDESVEFDHIIPWSKGGSSDEHNIRLLCKTCNRIKGSRFEDEYLVSCLSDHVRDKFTYEFVTAFLAIMKFVMPFYCEKNRMPAGEEFCRLMGRRKTRAEDEASARLFKDVGVFFNSERPTGFKVKEFNALRLRWGFDDGKLHRLKEVAQDYCANVERLLCLEMDFIGRLGFSLSISESQKLKWLKT